MKKLLLLFVATLVFGVPRMVGAADFTPPADNVLTEKQLVNYVGAYKEEMELFKSLGVAAESVKGVGGVLALSKQYKDKTDAILAKYNFTDDEYAWVSNQVMTTFGAVKMQQAMLQGQGDLDKGVMEQQGKIDAATQKLADLAAAQKAGRKYLTTQESQAIVTQAKLDAEFKNGNVKEVTDQLKQATEEVAKFEAAEAAAEKAAKNPPGDLQGDDKQSFIEQKTTEANDAKTQGDDARARVADVQKTLADLQAELKGIGAKMANPDVPVTEDEKKEAAESVSQEIRATTEELKGQELALSMTKESAKTATGMANEFLKDIPPANAQLVMRHLADLEGMMGIATQP